MSKSPYSQARSTQFNLRLSDELHARIMSHARANSRSMNTEIFHTLQAAYPAPAQPEGVNEALLDASKAILDDWSKTLEAIGQDPDSNPRVAALSSAIKRASEQVPS